MLIRCAKCNKKFSDKIKTCPLCGEPADEKLDSQKRKVNEFFDLGLNELFHRKADKYISQGYILLRRSDSVIRLYKANYIINIFIVASVLFICLIIWFIWGILSAVILFFPLAALGIAAMRQAGTVTIFITQKHRKYQIKETGHVLKKKNRNKKNTK